MALERLLDDKLDEIHKRVESHDQDIRAFKSVLGAFLWLGGAVLAGVVALQGWWHK